MRTPHPHTTSGVSRRTLLQAGLAAGVTLSAWPLAQPAALWGVRLNKGTQTATEMVNM